jgi:urease accessory protein
VADARQVRGTKPVIPTNLKSGIGVEAIVDAISAAVLFRV